MLRPTVVRSMAAVALFLAFAATASAGTRSRVETSRFAPLQAPVRDGASVKIGKLPLVDDNETIIVEEFEVLAPDAVIEVFGADGKPTRVKPQGMRHYRGTVAGDPESIVYLSSRGPRVNGIIITRERKFSVWSVRRSMVRQDADGPMETFIEEMSAEDEAQMYERFICDNEKMPVGAAPAALPRSLAANELNVKPNALTGTQRSVLTLAIETDSAMYTNFASNATTVETFTRDLIAATSTIYVRDLQTEIRIGYLGVHTTTDPFAVNPGQSGTWDGQSTTYVSDMAMLELGDRWNSVNKPSNAARSATMLLSGQSQLSGIAWLDVVCTPDFKCEPQFGCSFPYTNHYGGAYSYNGGIGLSVADRTVPNPDALTNFGAPNNGYWPLIQVAHELGHNVSSPHTHCTTLTPAEQAQYSVSRGFVDVCRSGDPGCYSGATSLPAEAPGGRGSIMSYCHLLAFGNGTRFTFGQPGEAAHKMTTAMRATLDSRTPGLSAITAPASVNTGGSGTASVTNAGLTYTWTIVNGTFTGGGTTATGASVNFTGTTNPVTLTVTGMSTTGCAITDSKQVSVSAVTVNPPTGVTATATSGTSVTVAFTASATATSYNVYRSSGAGFTKISTDGAVTGTVFTDTTVVAGTAYLYKVRGVASGTESADSNSDFAVPMSYTDPTLTTTTGVKAVHLTQLTAAANALRTLAGLGAISFTQGTPATGGACRASHVSDLRAGINLARANLGFAAATFATDSTVSVGTAIRKAHVDEMRAALQ